MAQHRSAYSFLLLALVAAPAFSQGLPEEMNLPPVKHPIMHVSPDWVKAHQARRRAMPYHRQATPEEFYASLAPAATNTMGVYLASSMNFNACGGVSGWDQGQCGNCWVWGSTAAVSADYGKASGTQQLFSVQWFDSDYYATGNGTVCNGGDSSEFAKWYNSHKKFIPWSNTNAGYADSNGPSSPATSASSISQTPSVSVSGITVSQIATNGVGQAQAIANIKAALNAGHPVSFSYFLPGAGWTDFENAWSKNSQTTPWAGVDKYNGTTWDSNSGGHLVCIVGYDNTNSSWVVLNSWGTTSGRPDGYFELPQAMGYDNTMRDSGSSFYQYEFDVFNVTGWPSTQTALAISTQPTSKTVSTGASVTFNVAATGGTAPYKYQWYKNNAAISGATSAAYTFTTAATDNGATFFAKVTDSAATPATVTSSTATLSIATQTVNVSITPGSASLATGATQQFTASVTGSSNTAVTWTATGGSVSAAGLYTAPSTAGTYTVKATSAADTSKSASATVTVTASAAKQLILNSGFESGTASWSGTTGDIGTWSNKSAHAGTHYCWLDGNGKSATESISQSVTIPSSVTSAVLKFWLHIDTAETTTSKVYDTLKVQIISGSTTTTAATYSNLNKISGYNQMAFDITAFKGKTITVKFLGVEDSSLQTSFVLDDVTLDIQ